MECKNCIELEKQLRFSSKVLKSKFFLKYKKTRVNLSIVESYFREGKLIMFASFVERKNYHWQFKEESEAIRYEKWLDSYCFDSEEFMGEKG